MKTSFLPKNNSQRLKWRIILVLAIFTLCAVFFSFFGGSLIQLASPVWRADTALHRGLRNAHLSLRSKDSLLLENEMLKERLAAADELVLSLRAIAVSRDELLMTYGRSAQAGTPAGVLVRPPKTPYDILIVDAGENAGAALGDRVSLPGGSLIGSVTDIFSRTARVKLFSTSGEKTPATLERGSVPVELLGRGGGNFTFTVPRDVSVQAGDRVISAQLATSLLAVVGEVEVTATDAFKTVYAISPANPASIRYVVIEN